MIIACFAAVGLLFMIVWCFKEIWSIDLFNTRK